MIWVSSSAALVAVCAISLFWVVPRLQRRREGTVEAQVEIAGTDLAHDEPLPRTEPPFPGSRRRRSTMATTDTAPRPPARGAGHRPGTLRLKRDRASILLTGCTALLAALVTAVVAPFSAAVSWPWPVFLLLLGIGCVLALRYLAVQERAARRRARQARGSAPAPVQPPAPRADVALFDHDDEHERTGTQEAGRSASQDAREPELPAEPEQPRVPAPAAFTVEELRAEALRVARQATGSAAERTWDPVPVPRPTYAEAPVVQRPAPEPLPVPEQPVSRSASLKDAVRTGEEQGRAALDLDDVLKRRRA